MRSILSLTLAAALLLSTQVASAQYDQPFQEGETADLTKKRDAMVEWLGRRVKGISPKVLQAFRTVPRHKYMKARDQKLAYKNKWAGIGYGQTITNPWMVAYMTHLLDVEADHKVLEIGTGSGYQGSILAQLTPKVHTVEIIRPLAERSHALVGKIGYMKNIKTRIADGYFGWAEAGPFDRIMVTCAADHIPIPLIQQLKPGGLMLIPVGGHFQRGNIYLVTKNDDGSIRRKVVATGTFVPMRRKDVSKDKK